MATLSGTTDFETFYEYDDNLRIRAIEQDGPGAGIGVPIQNKRVEFDYDENTDTHLFLTF